MDVGKSRHKKRGPDQNCVTVTGAFGQNVTTFGCQGDMSPTCWRLSQPSFPPQKQKYSTPSTGTQKKKPKTQFCTYIWRPPFLRVLNSPTPFQNIKFEAGLTAALSHCCPAHQSPPPPPPQLLPLSLSSSSEIDSKVILMGHEIVKLL